MKHTKSGWAIGLKDSNGRMYFLGRDVDESFYHAKPCNNPCDPKVYENLFISSNDAKSFWKNCVFGSRHDKSAFAATPVKVKLSVEVEGLGFGWKGLT